MSKKVSENAGAAAASIEAPSAVPGPIRNKRRRTRKLKPYEKESSTVTQIKRLEKCIYPRTIPSMHLRKNDATNIETNTIVRKNPFNNEVLAEASEKLIPDLFNLTCNFLGEKRREVIIIEDAARYGGAIDFKVIKDVHYRVLQALSICFHNSVKSPIKVKGKDRYSQLELEGYERFMTSNQDLDVCDKLIVFITNNSQVLPLAKILKERGNILCCVSDRGSELLADDIWDVTTDVLYKDRPSEYRYSSA